MFKAIDVFLIDFLLNSRTMPNFHRLKLEDSGFADLPSFKDLPNMNLDSFRELFSPKEPLVPLVN